MKNATDNQLLSTDTNGTPSKPEVARRRPRRGLRMLIGVLMMSAVGVVGVGATAAHAASGGYVECGGNYFDGVITVHPGNVSAGIVATEYLYVASGGRWVYTNIAGWATSYGNGYWNTTWNVISFRPLPYHRASYAIYEVLSYGGRVLSTGWYNVYDNGAFTSPRYTSSCYWAY